MNRRELMRIGVGVTAGAAAASHGSRAFGHDKPAPAAELSAAEVAARLTRLRARRRHIGPPSPAFLRAVQHIPRSTLVYDLAQVEENYLTVLEARSDAAIYYAIKPCANPRVLQRVTALGGGFDVASREELDLALDTGVAPSKCIFANTVKFPDEIRYAFMRGVIAFVADSENEVRKLAMLAKGSKLYVRLAVENKEAAFPLTGKFGTTPENVRKLLRLGKELGLEPYGTHFHVGSQCYSAKAWERPAEDAASIFRDLKKEGINLTFFNIGGGYPAPYPGRENPTVKDILEMVGSVLNGYLTRAHLQALIFTNGKGLSPEACKPTAL